MDYLEYKLKTYQLDKLAEWYDKFNFWEYPDDFVISKPEDWEDLLLWSSDKLRSRTKYSVVNPYMKAIENIIGRKECLRYHHIHNIKMKNYQFELWWFGYKLSGFVQKLFPNFYFDFYTFMKWETQ